MIKKLKINLLVILTIISTGCKTIELEAHSPVKCLGQPEAHTSFTDEEKTKLTDNMKLKIRVFAVTLRQRIIDQCEINKEHDKDYKD